MIPNLRLDERLSFYRNMIENIFDHQVSFEDNLSFIHEHNVPANLVSTAARINLINSTSESKADIDIKPEIIHVLTQNFDIECFFDGWDTLLIFAYLEYISSQSKFVSTSKSAEYSDILEDWSLKLYQMMRELEKSLNYLNADITDGGSQRQEEYNYKLSLENNIMSHIESYIRDCRRENNEVEVRNHLLEKLKAKYYSLESLDDEFNNMYEFLGSIIYHGDNHRLYNITNTQVRVDVENEFNALNFAQKLGILSDHQIDELIDAIDLGMVDNLNKMTGLVEITSVLEDTDMFDTVIRNLELDFLSRIPKYNP